MPPCNSFVRIFYLRSVQELTPTLFIIKNTSNTIIPVQIGFMPPLPLAIAPSFSLRLKNI